MVDEVGLHEAEQETASPAPLFHQELYTATNGTQWLMEARVQWHPHFESRVRLLKMPERTPVRLPLNLPYLEVVPKTVRDAALDGRYDLQAITHYYLQR
ncbi:MAG: hypothetical protein NZ741_12995, partial [Armatimonadetes bacterium]|nr:hypothetical protein [Armatimonadota bacterium]